MAHSEHCATEVATYGHHWVGRFSEQILQTLDIVDNQGKELTISSVGPTLMQLIASTKHLRHLLMAVGFHVGSLPCCCEVLLQRGYAEERVCACVCEGGSVMGGLKTEKGVKIGFK